MKNILLLGLLAYLCLNLSIAKNNQLNARHVPSHRTCSTIIPPIEWENNFQQKIQQFVANQQSSRVLANYTIPVVVHVVYWNATQNISQAQVNSQIAILNADYAGTGLNSNTVPTAFAALKANTNISFCLAQKTPTGTTMAEPGIDRVNAQTKGFSNPANTSGYSQSYINNTIKPNTIWDPTKYMNIWVLYIDEALLGYATFPLNSGLTDLPGTGTATTDGVVIGYTYFGNTGVVESPYDKGRTTTHEVGHWLGLRHISGDEECGTDYCADTPPQEGNAGDGQGLNYGCPTYPFQVNGCGAGTSPNGELFMNFMDYVDDPCMYLFTPNQRTRMQTAMENGTYRAPLASSTVCNVTPQAPIADFTASRTSVCPGNTVQFTDASSNAPTSWSWSFTGGTPATSTSQNPLITYNSAGTYAVTLTATNSLGSDAETKTAYIVVANPTPVALPLVEGFQSPTFPPTGWSLTSNSTFNWERTTAAGGFGLSSASMRFNNSLNDAEFNKDDITTPVVNLNVTNPRIKFDVAYARYEDFTGIYPDTIEVLVKNYCTGLITSVYKKGGAQLATAPNTDDEFVPTSAQWRKDSVNIPAGFLNNNIQVIFRNYGMYGNVVYVDNINIYGTASTPTGTPTAAFTASDTTVCATNNLTFTSNSTSSSGSLDSVRWTIPGGIPSTSIATTVTSTFNTAGTYVITLKAYKNGNVSTVTKSIRVKALPTVAATTGASSVCVGSTTLFANTTSGDVTVWSSSATGIATVNANGVVTGVSVGTAEIIYTVTTSGCSKSIVKLITVNALPTVAAITGAASICAGSTTTFSSTTPGGVWESGEPNIAPINANGVIIGANPGTSTISYTVTINGCSKTVTKSITVNAAPTVAATTGATSVCVGSTTTFVNATTGGTWSTSAAGIATVNANGVVTGVSSGTAEIRYTVTSNGCSTTATKLITVNAAPTVAATTGTTSVCVGSTTLFANTTAGGVWESSAAGIATVNGNGVVTGVSAGTAEIWYTVTVNGCSKSVIKLITVNALPTVAAITGATSICAGSTTTFSNSTAGGVWESGEPNIAPINANGVIIGANPGTSTISYTVTINGCSKTVTKSITVNAAPTVAATTGATSVCVGSTTTFVNATTGGTWSTSAAGIATVNANGVVTGVSSGTAEIRYTVTSNGCSTTATKLITVNALPTVAATTGTTSVCVGSTTTFVNATTGGTWSTSAAGIATVNANGVVTGVSSGTAEIRYTVTSNGCSTTATKLITVNALPTVAAITGATSVCVGSSTTFANTTTGGTWSTSAAGIATVNANGVVTGVSSGTAEIWYTVTVNGCSKGIKKLITVNALPTVAAITGTTSVCVGSTTVLSSATTGGTWSTSAATIATVNANGVVSGLSSGAATISYTITSNGCTKSVTTTVNVSNSAPTITITPNNASVCAGNPITLTANGASNYTWSQTGTISGSTLTFIPTVNPTTVTVTGNTPGCSATGTGSTSVSIKPKPTVSVSSPEICSGTTAQPTAIGANTYVWTGGLSAVANPITPVLTGNQSYTVIGDVNGCKDTAVSNVTVKSLPSTPVITLRNDTLTSSVTGVSYTWYKAGIFFATTSIPTLKITQNGVYTVEVVGANQCTSALSVNFNAILTGIKNNKLDIQYSIVPNPNNGSFEIRITSVLNKTYQLKLYSVSGQIILSDELNIRSGQNSKLVNLTGIEKGVYFLSLMSDEGVSTQNIIVQ